MDTVYPDDDEIKFRNKKFKGIEDLLNNKVECTICNNDLLNEIITKKMIMVHRSYLFLCCYKCFYKLCEGQEYSCILCKSNNELSNCEKCNFNVCKRCVENHNIIQVFNGVINKCFNCEPQALWKQRAQAANVLTTFSSQLDLPNGLLVNEVEREQIVRKYLVNESKISQSSTTDKVKNHLCFNFILNTYKCTVTEKLSNFPKIDCIPFDKCIIEFMENCEYILERTCSTLTNFKRIFNLSSNLSPGVISMIKTLLKSVDEDDSIFNSSRYNIGNECKVMKNNEINEISTVCKTKTKSKIKQNTINCILNSTLSTLNNETNHGVEPTIFKEPTVLLERIDESIFLKKMNNKLTQVLPNTDKDETVHPLDLFDDLSSISSDTGCSRILRSSTKKTKKMNKLTKNKCPLNEKSDDEKENDRLTKFNKINQRSKTNNRTDINLIDVNNSSSIVSNKNSKNKENKVETMQQIIKNLDDTDSGSDNGSENDYSQESAKDIFKDINNSLLVPQINSDVNSDDSDDSSINDVINTCLITCKRYGIDHYRNKNQENKIVIDDIEKSGKFDESEEITEISEFSDKNDENVTANPSKNISPFRMPSLSDDNDSDFNVTKKMDSNKRKLITTSSSNESDSSSKYFKKSPKKRTKSKNNFFELTYSSCRNYIDYLKNITTRKRRRIRKLSTDNSDKESDDERSNSITTTPTKGRKNIRKMKNENELSELTKDALKEEKSRKMRMEKRQQIYNQIYDPPTPIESCKKLVLDFDSETKEELITVHPDLVKFLKPHQVDGVKFLWDSVFESLEFIKQQKKGSGSILAHCMGLGKTLQVITLIHTLFRYPEIGIKTVLIITPHTTIENWCKEFKKWLNNVPEETNFFVHNFSETKTYESRKNLVDKWQRENGVLVTSYQSYRAIVQFKGIDKFPTLLEALVDPGPDLIICDEGHLLKNHSSAISKTVNRIKTLRRIVLTGTPLQNNLKEYHCMVDFIRPNLLGSLKDFTNRFINPITNGQYSDSTPLDVALMKRRSHVLHRMLEGFVQRRDYAVLTPFLPPKQEYVIYLKMSDKQIELYKKYLDKYRQSELFANYHMLQMIWTHPKLLAMYSKQVEKKKLKDMESKLTDKSDSESHSNSIEEIENVNHNWWKEFMTKKDFETVYPYSKFIMLFSLLQECEEIGDKVLIFSQSLNTLDLIQDFLENAENISDDMGSPYGKSWYPGEDFFRIDGSVNLKDREDCCDRFNDTTNAKMRLLLLSTKAFNLGVNLVAANRVIIFDVTWNPTLNVQSIFRVFRFGQTKPCYIYRFVSEGTMEQKIYQRQISKLSMAFRVVDEHQIDRHFNAKNQEELYEFAPNTSAPKTVNLPKDRLMAELILKHKDLVIDILEHDSLLQNNEDEELDENDRNAAWEDYEKEKSGLFSAEKFKLNTNQMNFPVNNLKNNEYTLLMNSLPEDVSLFNTLRTVFPSASVVQLNDMLIQVKSQAEQ